ncbi:MAG: alpha-2-macroglobulin, partial [Planctomycetes bacterium]|nr:alpha-2-macroglobulin [Planctomycetota bacterium]
IHAVNPGGGSFRVEEYKKPEFEVTIEAPQEPVALGDKVTATIRAKYYFGSPVTQATVKYKVLRTPVAERWYPPMPWDWLYGPGYWWFAEDYWWYPGWARWGCLRPSPWWFWRAPTPPEVVMEREVAIGPDGTIDIEIDTAIALQFHPDQDHSYQIQAEVVDQSRRTIVGNGRVLVARQPFRVYVWTHRGHYRVGDTIEVGAAARTLDGKPVTNTGTLRLLKIQYDDSARPVETEAGRWELATGENGQAKLQIKASEAGQYRLAYELTDSAGNKIEGGHVITIAGEAFDGSQFRFNDLELVPDRREYQAGDKVALRINTNRTGAAVLLFVRPTNGVYLPPQLVRLEGKSTLVEVEVTAKDTPNFFIEAVAVHGGRVHTVAKEIFVPPVKRVLGVEVVPSADTYLPDSSAKFTLKLTDSQGLPFVGSLAVSIYDKALDYIAGGSNVADIREFFWKWRRNHRPQGENNLQQYSAPLVKRNRPTMQNLGIFGDTVVDEVEDRSFGRGFQLGRSEMKLGASMRSAPMASAMAEGAGGAMLADQESAAEPAAETVEPTVRENFADTALWVGTLETNAEGLAEVELDMPQNLTTWKVHVWAMGHGTRVGEGAAEVVTRKNVIIRLQAPRFFVERDEVVLSGNVHNYLPHEKQVRVLLELEGDTLAGPAEMEQTVTIAAGGEQRLDWRVKAVREGTA